MISNISNNLGSIVVIGVIYYICIENKNPAEDEKSSEYTRIMVSYKRVSSCNWVLCKVKR